MKQIILLVCLVMVSGCVGLNKVRYSKDVRKPDGTVINEKYEDSSKNFFKFGSPGPKALTITSEGIETESSSPRSAPYYVAPAPADYYWSAGGGSYGYGGGYGYGRNGGGSFGPRGGYSYGASGGGYGYHR